jgi:hypothetical protein
VVLRKEFLFAVEHASKSIEKTIKENITFIPVNIHFSDVSFLIKSTPKP